MCTSPPRSGTWSKCWSATLVGWFPNASYSTTCGAPGTRQKRSICAYWWAGGAGSSRGTIPAPGISTPSQAWGTASNPEAPKPSTMCASLLLDPSVQLTNGRLGGGGDHSVVSEYSIHAVHPDSP